MYVYMVGLTLRSGISTYNINGWEGGENFVSYHYGLEPGSNRRPSVAPTAQIQIEQTRYHSAIKPLTIRSTITSPTYALQIHHDKWMCHIHIVIMGQKKI